MSNHHGERTGAATGAMKPVPKHVQRQLGAYVELLGKVREAYYPHIDPNLRPRRGPRSVNERLRAGANAGVTRLLHELLWDSSIRAVSRGRPVTTWETPQGHKAPAWTTTRMSPVGMDTRLYKRLQRQRLLTGLERIGAALYHIVTFHQFVPEGTAEDSVWSMMSRMDERFWEFWPVVVGTGRIVGAFAIRHFDPLVYGRRRGILLHYHVAAQVRGTSRLPSVILSQWCKTAQSDEVSVTPFAEPRGGPDGNPYDIRNLLLYVGRTEQVRGFRRPNFLCGMRHSKFIRFFYQQTCKRKQAVRNGETTMEQLRLMLVAASYPVQDPGLLLGWDDRTREGKAFLAALKAGIYM